MKVSGFSSVLCAGAAIVLMSQDARALPADAACVYLAIGCYAPSPVPAPAFPDPLFAPIQVPSIFAPASPIVAVSPPAFDPEPLTDRRIRHHRKARRHRMSS